MPKQMVVVKDGAAEALQVMGVQVKFLCTGEKTSGGWSLMENTVPEGFGPPPHRHPWDEAYFILAGEIRFSLEGREQVFGAGDFVYAPANTLHGFSGASKSPARMIIFDTPAHAESFFREVHREVRQVPGDLAKVPAIGERHDIHFVRPRA
jgi:quercetin dioxygenase-like cupin family protein